jgi:hypothetical protein
VTLVSPTNIVYHRSKCKHFFQRDCVDLQVVVREGFAERLFKAHSHLEGREGVRISREEIGKRIGKVLRSSGPDQSTVASWFNRGIIPAPDLGIVVAKVYGISPGWLYFNEGVMLHGNHEGVKPMPPEHLERVVSKRRKTGR